MKKEYSIKPSIFHQQRKLLLEPNSIQFQISTNKTITLYKENLIAIRYGVKWIKGYRFYIGRKFCIEIMDSKSQIVSIAMSSLYRINAKKHYAQYQEILKELYRLYFEDLIKRYLEMFSENKAFEILGVKFFPSGVQLKEGSPTILWQNVGTKAYDYYYALYSKENELEHVAFDYLKDWNAVILFSVSRNILEKKNRIGQ